MKEACARGCVATQVLVAFKRKGGLNHGKRSTNPKRGKESNFRHFYRKRSYLGARKIPALKRKDLTTGAVRPVTHMEKQTRKHKSALIAPIGAAQNDTLPVIRIVCVCSGGDAVCEEPHQISKTDLEKHQEGRYD